MLSRLLHIYLAGSSGRSLGLGTPFRKLSVYFKLQEWQDDLGSEHRERGEEVRGLNLEPFRHLRTDKGQPLRPSDPKKTSSQAHSAWNVTP